VCDCQCGEGERPRDPFMDFFIHGQEKEAGVGYFSVDAFFGSRGRSPSLQFHSVSGGSHGC